MVENAVKHGISNLVAGGRINIVIKQNEQGLMIQVKNTGQIQTNEETFGLGLENTKRRLDLQYKNRASLLMYEEEDMVVSQILLKN
jgi:two-component system LytT family sensor kinase